EPKGELVNANLTATPDCEAEKTKRKRRTAASPTSVASLFGSLSISLLSVRSVRRSGFSHRRIRCCLPLQVGIVLHLEVRQRHAGHGAEQLVLEVQPG